MSKWYKKSKYNNPPIISYVGRCSNCGAKHIGWVKDEVVECCGWERVSCSMAIDENEGKIDCGYGRHINRTNDGSVAKNINEGMSEKEAMLRYKTNI
jgi:hypothetical protein